MSSEGSQPESLDSSSSSSEENVESEVEEDIGEQSSSLETCQAVLQMAGDFLTNKEGKKYRRNRRRDANE